MKAVFQKIRMPNFRESLVISVVVILVGFFLIHGPYYPQLGIVGNAMNGHIVLTDNCSEYGWTIQSDGGLRPDGSSPPFYCGLDFRYRWLLIVIAIFVAWCWHRENRSKSCPSWPSLYQRLGTLDGRARIGVLALP